MMVYCWYIDGILMVLYCWCSVLSIIVFLSRWLYAVDQTDAHLSQSSRLETRELRGFLARRRWLVWCGLVRGAIRISRSHGRRGRRGSEGSEGSPASRNKVPSYLSSSGEIQLRQGSLVMEGLQGRWKIAYF